MTEPRCKPDPLATNLRKHLERSYDIAPEAFDAGYGVLQETGAQTAYKRDGANDGCSTYQEVLRPALLTAIDEGLTHGRSALMQLLDREHGLRLPCLWYRQDKPTFNADAWETVRGSVDYMRRHLTQKGYDLETPVGRRELARRLFDELLPHDALRESSKLRDDAVWRFYAVMQAVGLKPHFVLIPVDPLGRETPLHLALRIDLGEGEQAVIDPVFQVFDLAGLPAVELDVVQALSIYYTQRALESRTKPLDYIKLARRIDPDNIIAEIYEWHAMADIHDPLQTFRQIRGMLRHMAMGELRRTAAANEPSTPR